MTSQNPGKAPSERRERAKREVKQLITERNNVLSQYYNLVKQVESLDAENGANDLLQEFCQELVDYLATGHFELYRRIEEGNERRDEIIKLTDEVMPQITNTTQVAIAFNDLFDSKNDLNNEMIDKLPGQLSQLGEQLATRIDLEDKVINALLASTPKPDLRAVSSH